MFDLGWGELLIIGVIALIVVGPKDLPGMFRTIGRFTGKMRGLAREFQRAMDRAADETGVGDIAKDLKKTVSSKNLGLNVVNEMTDRVSSTWKAADPDEKPTGDKSESTESTASAAKATPATASGPAVESPLTGVSPREEPKTSDGNSKASDTG
ncbi:MAG: Sec-independent protein translocase protein TatB [Rhodobacteraceae bacterium]|nr:Sec-independent protein translocase protein TatB [Paracoccaceae bacterium]